MFINLADKNNTKRWIDPARIVLVDETKYEGRPASLVTYAIQRGGNQTTEFTVDLPMADFVTSAGLVDKAFAEASKTTAAAPVTNTRQDRADPAPPPRKSSGKN